MRKVILIGGVGCLLIVVGGAYTVQAEDSKKADAKLQATDAAKQKADEKKTADAKAGKPAKPTTAKVAVLTIKDTLPESVGQMGMFGQMQRNLGDMIRRLDKVAGDKDISAVILRIRNPAIGRGKLGELRGAVARARQAGKRVFAQLEMATATDYLLAASCQRIVMPPSGMVIAPGVRAEITFYKGLLDKLGIQADILQVGKFKGASEPMTRKGMSPEFRRQFELLIDDFHDQLVDTIAADRKLDRKKVRELIDRGLFSAEDAKQAGLIDQVAYEDQFQESLTQLLGADKVSLVKDYGKKKVDTNFSGMLGMVKLMEMMMGGKASKSRSKVKKIAIVYAVGTITSGSSETGMFGGRTMGSDTIVKALRKADKDKTVAAIVLRVSSPGGSGLASDLIWREIQRIKKPVVASMGDVAASGGYYISMGCDKIYADPGTLTGSIGVVGGKLALGGLYKKIGLATETVSRGKNSGLFSSEAPFSKSEREVLLKVMRDFYERFVRNAAAGRKMDRKKLQSLAEGRLWTGRQAKASGLVDETGTLQDAVTAAKQLAGIKADQKTETIVLPKPKSFFEQLFQQDASIESGIRPAIQAVAPEAARHMAELEILGKLFTEPAVVILPYKVQIK